jgi:hypothetical protein
MDCTLRRNATRKQTRMARNLADSAATPAAPTTMFLLLLSLLLRAAAVPERRPWAAPLAMSAATRELRVMATVASTEEAMMEFRMVCTASTACLPEGSSMIWRTQMRRLMALMPMTVVAGRRRMRRRSHRW